MEGWQGQWVMPFPLITSFLMSTVALTAVFLQAFRAERMLDLEV